MQPHNNSERMTPIIKNITVKHPASFTWLKYINGVDLSHHCAKSLLGTYEQRWHRYGNKPIWSPLTLPVSPFYYFCAVTPRWENNAHVAFVYKEGATMIVDNDQVYMEVENAEALPINQDCIDWNLPQSQDKAFNTCRNWWFASYLAKHYYPNCKKYKY